MSGRNFRRYRVRILGLRFARFPYECLSTRLPWRFWLPRTGFEPAYACEDSADGSDEWSGTQESNLTVLVDIQLESPEGDECRCREVDLRWKRSEEPGPHVPQ